MKIFEEKGYTYQKHLSTGGEGEVHLIKSIDKDYIAKIFPRLDESSVHLLNHIKQMNVPNIPKIYEIFNYQDKTIVIRDYIDGSTLYDEIRKNENLSFKRAKSIIIKICETLKTLHNSNPDPIIYRDLKPENIILNPNGDVYLIDFGIARYHKQEATRDTVLAGTRGYTAPEVMAGMQSDNRSDIYSVGLLFYEMLTGKNILEPPYQIRPVKESNELLPEWLDKLIKKATDINQVNRYSCIEEFVFDLMNPENLKQGKKRVPGVLITVFVLLLTIAGIISWYYLSKVNNETYEMLLELEFDDEEDKKWVYGYDSDEESFVFLNEQLHVLRDGCNIDYVLQNGMMAHFRINGSVQGAVGIGPYRVNANINFECVYHNENDNIDYTTATWGQKFYGMPVKADGQFIDVIIYTTPDNNAVYAIAIDQATNKISYVSYKIPEYFNSDGLFAEIYNFKEKQSDYMIVESIKMAEGSLRKYLEDNFEAYRINKKRADEFLQKDIAELPEMVLKPFDEWQ